mmetsp:Transcript_16619/g.68131  ORF Transcript_16619/g.68131 Transcript_16619/m.68131 type:complete len:111 (+) Transcript_16619:610-942(+)
MSSAMEIGVPKLGPTAGNSTGEEESALSPPCSSYKIDSVAENEPLVNSATDVNGIRIWNDLDALSFIASLPPLSSILNRPKVRNLELFQHLRESFVCTRLVGEPFFRLTS